MFELMVILGFGSLLAGLLFGRRSNPSPVQYVIVRDFDATESGSGGGALFVLLLVVLGVIMYAAV